MSDSLKMDDISPNQKPTMPLELTSQQLEVLNALKGKENEKYPLSQWYLGALYALNNDNNPDRISQAAHSLRELLEKLPRVVREMDAQSLPDFSEMRRNLHERFLKDKEHYEGAWKDQKIDPHLSKTLRKFDDYLERNQQPTRKKQMQTAIAAIDPMVEQLADPIRKEKRDNLHKLWQELEKFAHHKGIPNIEEFEQCLNTLERIIFDLLAPITAQDQREIQSILEHPDISENNVERMLLLIRRRGANVDFFFNRITDAMWIPVLKRKGYFDQLPEPEPIGDSSISFPFWRPIIYLKKVAETDPHLVVDTILDFPVTRNPRILHEISEIALEIEPIEQSLRLKEWVFKYLDSPYQLDGSDLFAKLISRWAGASKEAMDTALNLMRTAVVFRADPMSQDKQKRREDNSEEWAIPLHPQPRFDEWEYEQILKEGVHPLAEKAPYRTAQKLIYVTENMIRLTLHPDQLEKVGSDDYSTIWCERVNETGKNYQDSMENLAHTLTFACEKVYEQAPESVLELDQALRNQHWNIFTRIRQHLYALYPNERTKPWIREMILAYENYNEWEYEFEFQRMIRLACEKFGDNLLTRDERERIFEAVLKGPSKKNFQEWAGDLFTEDLFEQRKRRFHNMQLKPFASVLFDKYASYFQELQTKEEQPITDADYAPYISDPVGEKVEERSPIPVDELKKFSDEKLLSYLNEWSNAGYVPDTWSVHIGFEGLARAFQSVFKEVILSDKVRLDFWINNRERIKRPIYVRAMVSAIREQVELKQFDMLDQWFDLCEWILSHPDQPEEEGANRSDESKEYLDWKSSRRKVGDFVETCLKKDVSVPIAARSRLTTLLDKLCTHYDWRLDDDKPDLLDQDDQLTEAINNTRSRALKNLVDFGDWVRRQSDDDQADTPEVFTILEKRLGPKCAHPLTKPEYAILGSCYAHIWGLNQKWAAQHKSDFFPQENLSIWKEAFGNYLRHSRPYNPIFDIFRGDFEFALDNINKLDTGSYGRIKLVDWLGRHLFVYYLREVYPLTGNDSLLPKFYEKTKENKTHWSHLFDYVGRILKNRGEQLEENLKQRVQEFFNWRIRQKEPSELKEFAFWLKAKCLDAEWRLKSYSQILDVLSGSKDIKTNIEIGVLQEMVGEHTALVIECFLKLTDLTVKNKDTIHIQPDKVMSILQAGLNSNDDTVRTNTEQGSR